PPTTPPARAATAPAAAPPGWPTSAKCATRAAAPPGHRAPTPAPGRHSGSARETRRTPRKPRLPAPGRPE
nr:hypothetical protein [Tanacetum cinerariifolium]